LVQHNIREGEREQIDFSRWWNVDRVGVEVTMSGRLFQIDGLATGNARPPTVDSLIDGTSRRLERAEWSERRPSRSATRTSRLRYVGADPCMALNISNLKHLRRPKPVEAD